MLRSMTAFGRTTETTAIGTITVEIQSVNRKHLDVKVICPPEIRRFEVTIQKWISESVFRGQVIVKINLAFEGETPISVRPNLELARQIKTAGDKIATELGITDPQFAIRLVGMSKELFSYSEEIKDEDQWKGELKKAIECALKPFSEMKSFEGKKLSEDFVSRIANLTELIESIDELSERSVNVQREKLTKTIESVLPGKLENQEAILREVCLFAEKVDIVEEITRFKAHLFHFRKTMENGHGVGKTLDFIVQELFRETNTIASKAADIEISRKTVEIKTELERIREQLQNVE